jgi:hypothetical protein
MTPAEKGGEAPCFAHLLDQPQTVTDELLAELVRHLADAVVIADPEGTSRSGTRRRPASSVGLPTKRWAAASTSSSPNVFAIVTGPVSIEP